MESFVLDCSVTMGWILPSQASKYADAVLDRMNDARALVPSIWELEVANVLLVQLRRKKITHAEVSEFLGHLEELNILTVSEKKGQVFHDVWPLAAKLKISSYDAAYLQLAMGEGIAISTLDQKLKKAARELGVSLFESF